jgi:hypothetical protein
MEPLGGTDFTCEQQLVLPDHVHQLDSRERHGRRAEGLSLLIRVYPAFVGRFCDEIAARKMITDTITGVRIQASGVPISRPPPTERRREGRTDPSVISAA